MGLSDEYGIHCYISLILYIYTLFVLWDMFLD